MNTWILEGAFAEVREQISRLPIDPKQHVKVVITEIEEGTSLPSHIIGFRNGVPILSLRENLPPLTTEQIQDLIRQEEEDDDLDYMRRMGYIPAKGDSV